MGLKSNDNCSLITIQGDKEKSRQHFSWHTGMPLVSRMRLGTCLAESALRIASWILFTRSLLNAWFNAIFRKSITLSSPSLLYWGTQRLSETSSKASTEKKGESLIALAFVYYSVRTRFVVASKEASAPQSCKGKTDIVAMLFYKLCSGCCEILTPA